jgi:hypothetical protein
MPFNRRNVGGTERGSMSAAEEFDKKGFFIVRGVLGFAERRAILRHEKLAGKPKAAETWMKDRGAVDPFYHRLLSDNRLISLLSPILGNDIVGWGVDLVKKRPGQVHPWHSDIESCAPEGGFASLWIGLAHTSRNSALHVISRSHRFGLSVQEALHIKNIARRDVKDSDILALAKARDEKAELIVPDLRNGDVLVFDGRLWHGSRSSLRWFSRTAALLQYARADRPVRMFDRKQLEWPLRYREDVLPPVVAVLGQASASVNRVVAAPSAA